MFYIEWYFRKQNSMLRCNTHRYQKLFTLTILSQTWSIANWHWNNQEIILLVVWLRLHFKKFPPQFRALREKRMNISSFDTLQTLKCRLLPIITLRPSYAPGHRIFCSWNKHKYLFYSPSFYSIKIKMTVPFNDGYIAQSDGN